MNATVRRLLQLALPIRGWMLLAALIGSATVLSGIGLMATSAYLISEAALHPSVAALSIAIVGVRFFGIARGVFRYLERLLSHRTTLRLLSSLRVWFYRALEPLMPARIMMTRDAHEELRSGDLLRRAVADIDTLQNFYIRVLAPPAIALLIGLITWLFLGAFGAVFGLVFIAFFALSASGVPLVTYLLSRNVGQRMVTLRAELYAQLVDAVQGLAELVAYGQEQRQAHQVQALTQQLNRLQMTMALLSGLQSGLTNFFMNMTTWVMLFVAIPYVRDGQLNGVFLALLVLSALASFEVVLPLSGAFQQLGGTIKAAGRVFEVVDAPPIVREPLAPSPEPGDLSITIEGLNFRYTSDEPYVLRDINLQVPEGRCVALVGPSGSGKSTLARLLLRFWDYQEGHIALGGHDLRDYRQEDLYALVSVVEQDTYLFNTTIRENLLLARPCASEEEMIRASQQAQLHEFVQSLPHGYDTQVGEQGLRLSGGERQRVAIARAFLKDAPILILDEPTVNLDAVTERAILHALHALRQGRTTLMITHRLVEMDMADEIIVLRDGEVVERGRHADLLQNEGLYWRMWTEPVPDELKTVPTGSPTAYRAS